MSFLRLFLVSILFGGFTLAGMAKPLRVIRSGATVDNKFDYVKQDPGFFVNELVCRKPGNIECEWVQIGSPIPAIVSDVTSQIEAAILTGATGGSVSGEGYSGTWTGNVNDDGGIDFEANLEVDD